LLAAVGSTLQPHIGSVVYGGHILIAVEQDNITTQTSAEVIREILIQKAMNEARRGYSRRIISVLVAFCLFAPRPSNLSPRRMRVECLNSDRWRNGIAV
jgi:hypothetical protein